jgi:hypothetical protein
MHKSVSACASICIAFVACSGPSPIGFDIVRPIAEQSVQGDALAHTAGTLLGSSPINPFQLQIDLSAEAAAHDSGPITDVRLRALTFSITSTSEPPGDTDCFDFVDSVTLSVESTQSGTQLQPQVIATVSQPGCVRMLSFDVVSTVNLAPYIQEGMRISSTGRGISPADDVSFDGSITLHAGI